ncbi:hypothetical protein K456DRAFT_928269 [Colletotrichum gloeosporioides 23]|nr:hypothetical protein K456DRAFT_928269 [Colletotrichum gloeosporioides 23]
MLFPLQSKDENASNSTPLLPSTEPQDNSRDTWFSFLAYRSDKTQTLDASTSGNLNRSSSTSGTTTVHLPGTYRPEDSSTTESNDQRTVNQLGIQWGTKQHPYQLSNVEGE